MKLNHNTYYTTTNASTYLYVINVIKETEDYTRAFIAFVSKSGYTINVEILNIPNKSIKYWKEVKIGGQNGL